MKQLIRISFIIAAILSSLDAAAQIGVNVGYLSTNNVNTASAVGGTDNTLANSGFYAGITYQSNIPKRDKWFYETGMNYSYFGGSIGDMKIDYHYLNIPFRVKFKHSLGSSPVGLFAFAGPLFSIGISAKEDHTGNPYLSNPVVSMYGSVLNRFDIKLGGGIGLELFNHLDIRAGYDFGIIDVSCKENHETRISYLYLGFGFNF